MWWEFLIFLFIIDITDPASLKYGGCAMPAKSQEPRAKRNLFKIFFDWFLRRPESGIILILVVFVTIVTIVNPTFLSWSNVVNILRASGFTMISVVGMSMIVVMLVIVAVFMIVVMLMIVAMFMIVVILMAVTALMLMAVDMSGNGLRLHVRSMGMPAFGQMAAEQIFHVMVMIFMGGVQAHIKIAHIQTGLLHPADSDGKSVHRQGVKRPLQRLPSRSQI